YPEFHPQARSPADDLAAFAAKVRAGADRAITQYFYNADAYFRFRDDAVAAGIEVPIIPGIMPINNYAQLARFSDNCGAEIPRWIRWRLAAMADDAAAIRAFGLEVVTDLCRPLAAAGAPGGRFDALSPAEPTLSIARALAWAGARRGAAGMPAHRPTPAARPAAIPASRRDCLSWPLDPEARSPAPLMDIDLVSRPIEAGDRLRTPAPPADPAGSLLRHYRLDVRSVAIGMWVAELDRPWLDTPFLIRGFRVENEQELETLRRHCEYVEVDIEKSDFEVVEAIRRAEAIRDEDREERLEGTAAPRSGARAVPPAEQARVENGPQRPRVRERRVSGGTRVRFRKLVQEATLAAEEPGGLRGLVRSFARTIGLAPDPARMAAERRRRHAELRRSLPVARPLDYRDTRPIEEELPRARSAFAKGCDTIETLLADIRGNRVTDVLPLHAAVEDMVASMIGNPDALMWVARLRDEDITTYSHGVKVALYMIALGRHLGFPKEDLNKLGM